jgi:hypothetical protein
MRNITFILLLFGLILLNGCLRVRAYQERATAKCEEHHTAEQCKPLPYPSSVPADNGGQDRVTN